MITDDHKTHAPPQSVPPSSATPQLATLQSVANPPDPTPLLLDSGAFSNGQGFGASPEDSTGMPQFRLSHSASDLQNLPQTFQQQFPPMPTPYTAPQAYSLSHTPRNLSRQASISGPSGPSTKKRKANSSGKVPTGLAMTKLETQMIPHGFAHAMQPSTTPPSATSPYFPNRYNLPTESPYAQPPPNLPQFHTGPPTPNSNDHGFYTPAHRSQSMENLPIHSLFSASNSAHPSRVPSPSTGQRNSASQLYQHAQLQMAQQVANGLYGLPLALNPHRPPVIHKLIPNEGPKAGGIEVTCLGSGFCQGLEVFFGDSIATTTTYWGDTSLVCLLPPALHAGTVPVTFKHDQQPMHTYTPVPIPKQHVLFKYVDDDEQQLLRLALSVLGQKMTGKREDVRDIARRIVGSSGGDPWGVAGSGSSSAGGQQRPTSTFDASVLGFMDLESSLLKCLDLIDLDDSPNQARLNLRRGSGQTMLHLACSLGFYRFVAALLARGANPEPRDRGGYTPMHYAVMHNHPQIVRRLILSGADPDTRTLRGSTAADLATSEEMLASTRRLEHHTRHRSGGSPRSKVSSAASLSSLWGGTPHSHTAAAAMATSGFGGSAADSSDEHGESSDNDDIDPVNDSQLWMRPKRSSRRISMSTDVPKIGSDPSCGVPQPQRDGAATPAMVAWRQQLATHFQHLQQLWNLPNLPNLPQIPPMPTLPDYQNYLGNRMGRLNSLVPLRNPSRSGGSSASEPQTAKEGDYRWWELFSVPSAPPAYEEIYPQLGSETTDKKTSDVAQAAVDALVDQKCAEAFDRQTPVSSSTGGRSSPVIELRIGGGAITKEAQEELRAAHARKLKKIKSDRNLFFIWVRFFRPLLLSKTRHICLLLGFIDPLISHHACGHASELCPSGLE
jgi:Ankyrin repeats (3 copies)/IPT/TIG domain